jgi:agmatinase
LQTLGIKQNFLGIEDKYSNLKHSKIAIVPAPYEHTTSYGTGTRNGPKAILNASHQVEFYDEEFDRELCFEKGIATLQPLAFGKRVHQQALDVTYRAVRRLLEMKKFVVTLGGEHTISIAPIQAHVEKFNDVSLLHFDAHSDLRESYEGTPYSHASFLSRVCEFFPPRRITQVGIRAQCIEENRFIRTHGVHTFYAWEIRTGRYGMNWVDRLVDTLSDNVYVTFDVDYFDPSIMPATGTPEPNGFFWEETMNVFRTIRASRKKIVGFDVVELAPVKGLHHPNLTTAKLVYKMLNYAF